MTDIDPRVIALRDRQSLESQRLADEFFGSRPDLDPCDDGPTPWTYEDNKAYNGFFAEAEARWQREGRELRAQIDAENAGASV